MDKIELLSCPFCGERPTLMHRRTRIGDQRPGFGIGCPNQACHLWLPKDVRKSELHNYVGVWAKEEDAIRAWNRRADSAKLASAIEVLRHYADERNWYDDLSPRQDNYDAEGKYGNGYDKARKWLEENEK